MAEAGIEPASSSKCCLICTVPIRFTRLGVHACRACAAFYKRSKISGKRLACRQGDYQCVFRKHEKFMCRSCRFDKCVELGMEYSPVLNETDKESSDETSEPSSSSDTKQPLLEAMRVSYEKSYSKRFDHEIYVAEKHKLKKLEHPTEIFYISNLHSFMEMFPTIIREIIEIFEQVFPFLKDLILEDKAALFQDFIGKFCIIEGFYRSLLYIPSNHFLASLITCIDCDNIDQWIRDEDWVERKADFRKFVRNYSDEYTDLLLPLFTLEKVSEPEFMALLIIGFCDVDLSLDLPESIFDTLESIRTSVFAELQEYYKKEELSDVSTRMGMLMTVAHSTSEAGLLMNEEYRTYSALFDICSGDTLLREISGLLLVALTLYWQLSHFSLFFVTLRSKNLRSTCHLLIGLCALLDGFHQIGQFYQFPILRDGVIDSFLCTALQILPEIGVIGGCASALCIGMERLTAVLFINQYRKLSRRQRQICAIPAPFHGKAHDLCAKALGSLNLANIVVYSIVAVVISKNAKVSEATRKSFRSIFFVMTLDVSGWAIGISILHVITIIDITDELRFIMCSVSGLFVNSGIGAKPMIYCSTRRFEARSPDFQA